MVKHTNTEKNKEWITHMQPASPLSPCAPFSLPPPLLPHFQV